MQVSRGIHSPCLPFLPSMCVSCWQCFMNPEFQWTHSTEKFRGTQSEYKYVMLMTKKGPVHSKGDQPWMFFGRNDAKAETPVLWPPHAKSWLIGRAGRDWGQEKGTTEDEMAGWHHRLDGLEFEWTPGDGDGQGGLACCDSWGRKESDTTEQLNDWTEERKWGRELAVLGVLEGHALHLNYNLILIQKEDNNTLRNTNNKEPLHIFPYLRYFPVLTSH